MAKGAWAKGALSDLPTVVLNLPTVVFDLPTVVKMIMQAPLAQALLAQAPLAIFLFFKFFAEAPLAKAPLTPSGLPNCTHSKKTL